MEKLITEVIVVIIGVKFGDDEIHLGLWANEQSSYICFSEMHNNIKYILSTDIFQNFLMIVNNQYPKLREKYNTRVSKLKFNYIMCHICIWRGVYCALFLYIC